MKWKIAATIVSTVLLFTPASHAADKARVLVFGDSNTWGWKPVAEGFPAKRHDDALRYGGILDQTLPNVDVVVDGLVGRRTDLDNRDKIALVEASDFNGAKALPDVIARQMPLDLVVIMLGTNDLQSGVGRTPAEVASSAFRLAKLVEGSEKPVFTAYPAPKVLVVAPPPMGDTSKTSLSGLFQAGEEPSKQLGEAFASEAKKTGIAFFDAGTVTSTDGIDGIHLTAENHKALGEALAPVVKELLSEN